MELMLAQIASKLQLMKSAQQLLFQPTVAGMKQSVFLLMSKIWNPLFFFKLLRNLSSKSADSLAGIATVTNGGGA